MVAEKKTKNENSQSVTIKLAGSTLESSLMEEGSLRYTQEALLQLRKAMENRVLE